MMIQQMQILQVSFGEVIAFAVFLTTLPTMMTVGMWKHLTGRIDKLEREVRKMNGGKDG